MLASDLIRRSLRLINVPGRGAALSSDDLLQAFEDLQDLLASKSVSRQFVPGIRRHFFALTAGKSIYSYGRGGEFDTRPFDDPAPVRIEDGYIRAASQIIDRQLVTDSEMESGTGWTAGAGWTFANGEATIVPGNDGSTLSQALAPTPGIPYELRIEATQLAGSITVQINQDGSPIVSQVIAGNGSYLFPFTFAGTTCDVTFVAAADSSLAMQTVSALEFGRDRLALPDAQGSDYRIKVMDQERYNHLFSKGTGGRPYQIQYLRNLPLAEVRFDNASIPGDILVLDVLVDRISIESPNDELRVNDQELRWLKYALANETAGGFGKTLRPAQVANMKDARNAVSASNRRQNTLRVDAGLRRRRSFDINRGDP